MRRASWRYCRSVAGVLLLTSLAKFYSATGNAKILDLPETLLPLTNRQTLWLVGGIELLVALYLLFGGNVRVKLIGVSWLGANFLLYRLGVILLTVGKPCPCLGSITQKIPLKPATIDHILTAVVAYLVFGSLFFLFLPRKDDKGAEQRGTGRIETTAEGTS